MTEVEAEGFLMIFVQQLEDGTARARVAGREDWVERDNQRNAIAEAAGTAVDAELAESISWDGDDVDD